MQGNQALNSGLLASVPNFVAARRVVEASDDQPQLISQHSFPTSTSSSPQPLDVNRLPLKRTSTTGPGMGVTSSRSSLAASTAKKRQSTLPPTTTHARLYKVLGDLFLLSGRMMDASVWYVIVLCFTLNLTGTQKQGMAKRLLCSSNNPTVYGMLRHWKVWRSPML